MKQAVDKRIERAKATVKSSGYTSNPCYGWNQARPFVVETLDLGGGAAGAQKQVWKQADTAPVDMAVSWIRRGTSTLVNEPKANLSIALLLATKCN